MDDSLWGADTVEEAVKLREWIHETLITANFKLPKYQANSVEFLDIIDVELVEKNTINMLKNALLLLYWV